MRLDQARPRVIFDSHHPKHYLTVRRLARRCEAHGIDVVWTAREKDVLVDLMRADGNDPHVLTTGRRGLVGKLGELVQYDYKLARLAREMRPFALMGKAVSLAHVGRLLGIPSLLINDDSAAANPQYRYLGFPFAHRILTAECLGETYGRRQRTYPGLMELAYLHPDAFTPDPAIRTELGVAPDTRIFLIRLVAMDAYHDVRQQGISRSLLDRVIEILRPHGQIYIVAESELPEDLTEFRLPCGAERLHHVLAECDLVLGDGPTVPVEAALLGRPAFAFSSYIPKNAYVRELERRFGLICGYTPGNEAGFLCRFARVLEDPASLQQWAERRQAMLAEWSDPTDVYWEELELVYRRAYPEIGAGEPALADGA
ncbi:MAG: DUF354 domain-containing protein [Alphaproteobacteria bacterium]|nr:DUF354 domain-containing protein [Alphaproteobacteria bacterium]